MQMEAGLVPRMLKGSPGVDTCPNTWLDLARYAKELFAAQDSRHFVLGLTLCGSLLWIWEFDRLGGIAGGVARSVGSW